MQFTDHILAKEGILTTFAIAKKVTPNNMKAVAELFKHGKMSKDKAQEILRNIIIEETKTAIINDKIPGLTINGATNNSADKKQIMEFTYFASLIAKKIEEKKISKYHCCYIINTIVTMLKLTEEDFADFHKKFKKPEDGDELPA
jgi:hypothetical protein